jgi:hypothetical protein
MADLALMLLLLVRQVCSMVKLSILLAFLNFNLQNSQLMSSKKNPNVKCKRPAKKKHKKAIMVSWGVESWYSYNPGEGYTDLSVFSIWLTGNSRL